jgi:3',5'-cyclic AMP phosphodiesterase CpdA
MLKLLVVSDLHHAGPGEQARHGHEARAIGNPLLRTAAQAWRQMVWLRDPCAHNHRLTWIIAANPAPDLVVANGDFTVDSAFVGVSDDAALESSATALAELRRAYGARFHATIGDHDLGKQSLAPRRLCVDTSAASGTNPRAQLLIPLVGLVPQRDERD